MSAAVPSAAPTQELDLDYLKSPHGQLRAAEAVLSLAALISWSEGYCSSDTGRFGFILFIVIVTLLEAILVLVVFVLKLDKKVPQVNVPLSLLLNDGISLVFHFIITTLSLLSIGKCGHVIAARVIAALFFLALFLVLVGLFYLDYISWQNHINSKEYSKETGTTITETSPTVLT